MIKFAEQIIKKAGDSTLRYFQKVGAKYFKKNPLDPVTQADLTSNKILVEAIQKKFPSHGIISEETGEYHPDAEFVWVIDPLDGTLNFSRGMPIYCTILALLRNGKPEFGMIYDPIHKELFHAERGKGAFLNHKRISCSKTRDLKYSSGSRNSGITPSIAKDLANLANVTDRKVANVISLGSIGLSTAYLAAGRFDWYVSRHGAIWDYAAPALLLKEAGCKISNAKGKPWTSEDFTMVAANSVLHKKLLKTFS